MEPLQFLYVKKYNLFGNVDESALAKIVQPYRSMLFTSKCVHIIDCKNLKVVKAPFLVTQILRKPDLPKFNFIHYLN
jgi:hypothetical protein